MNQPAKWPPARYVALYGRSPNGPVIVCATSDPRNLLAWFHKHGRPQLQFLALSPTLGRHPRAIVARLGGKAGKLLELDCSAFSALQVLERITRAMPGPNMRNRAKDQPKGNPDVEVQRTAQPGFLTGPAKPIPPYTGSTPPWEDEPQSHTAL